LGLETVLLGAAVVASAINSLLTTITLFHQVNEKTKLLHAIHSMAYSMATVAKSVPGLRLKENGD
jgi:hypothetical protein